MATFLRTRYQFVTGASGDPALLTYYWDSTGAPLGTLVTEAHARVRAAWAALAGVIVAGSVLAFTFPEADEIEETTGDIVGQAVGTLPSAVTFTAPGDQMPPQTQALVRFRTGTFIGGRRLQGRQFIPGWTEGANDSSGQVSAAVQANLTSYNNALGATIVTAMAQRVWHRPGGTGPGLSAPVIARSVNAPWAVLRSRRDA